MITIQQHIDQQHGGNLTAFARAVSASRPTVYSWIARGAMWQAGRVWDPATPRAVGDPPELAAPYGGSPLLHREHWLVDKHGDIVIETPYLQGETVDLNAADLAAMTEALNNET